MHNFSDRKLHYLFPNCKLFSLFYQLYNFHLQQRLYMAAFSSDTTQIRGNTVLMLEASIIEWYLQHPVK